MSEKAKYVLQRVLKYVVAIIASLCEAYVMFILCIKFGFSHAWSTAVWLLLWFLLWCANLYPLFPRRCNKMGIAENILSFVGVFVIMSIWSLSMFFSFLIADGSIYRDEYEIISRMPFVEAYMHENDMLDGYYESVINGPFSTSEEVAWAEERLAD